ncbi:hypothetical protein KKH05_00100 [Patescibacteria group bacterium]|nr:hypothetical protein [Patescibacteria group bacterium]
MLFGWILVGLLVTWVMAFAYCGLTHQSEWTPRRNAFMFGTEIGMLFGFAIGLLVAVATIRNHWFFGIYVATPEATPFALMIAFAIIFGMIGSTLALVLRQFRVSKMDVLALKYI